MKRKIYFFASSIIQIIASVYLIVAADKFINSFIAEFENYPESMKDRMLSMMQNSGHLYFGLVAGLCIIINVIIIYFAYFDKLIKHKKVIIALSVILLFSVPLEIVELLAIVNIIVAACAKPVKATDYPDKKKEMPKLEREKCGKKEIILAAVLVLIYFALHFFIPIDLSTTNAIIIYNIVIGIVLIILSLIFFKDLLKKCFNLFKKNLLAYFQNLIGLIGKGYLIYFVAALIALFLSGNVATNQTDLEQFPLWFSIPMAVIYAPIVEELVFRGCIRRFIKNDTVFIIVSAIAFGFIHVTSEPTILSMIIRSLPYVVLGGILAKLYVKSNNICTNISFHAFQNVLASVIIILVHGVLI